MKAIPRTRSMLAAVVALTFAVPALAAGGAAAGPGPTWHTSLSEAQALAESSGRPLLVDLYAEWCGWCKVLEREVFTSPQFRTFAEDYVLLRVDVEDGDEGSQLQARFAAYSLPTTLVLDPQLARIGRVEGYSPVDRFIQQIQAARARHGELLAMYERHLGSDSPEVLEVLARELHDRGDGRRAARIYERLEELGAGDAAQLAYRRADALRLAGELAQARSALDRAHTLAADGHDAALLEACDLLRIQIARAGGDCQRTVTAIEAFLAAHPKSRHQQDARQALRALGTCT